MMAEGHGRSEVPEDLIWGIMRRGGESLGKQQGHGGGGEPETGLGVLCLGTQQQTLCPGCWHAGQVGREGSGCKNPQGLRQVEGGEQAGRKEEKSSVRDDAGALCSHKKDMWPC